MEGGEGRLRPEKYEEGLRMSADAEEDGEIIRRPRDAREEWRMLEKAGEGLRRSRKDG